VWIWSSAFLMIPPSRLQQTLGFMTAPNERLTSDWRGIVQRVGARRCFRVIASLGSSMCDFECGQIVRQEIPSRRNRRRPEVRSRCWPRWAGRFRITRSLGESLASIRKFDVPIDQVTTSSLESAEGICHGEAEFDQGMNCNRCLLPFGP